MFHQQEIQIATNGSRDNNEFEKQLQKMDSENDFKRCDKNKKNINVFDTISIPNQR